MRTSLHLTVLVSLVLAASANAVACSSSSSTLGALPDGGSPSPSGEDASVSPGDASSPGDAAVPPGVDGSTEGDAGGLGVSCTGAAPSFASAVTPIFAKSCSGGELCHGGLATPPWTYAKLVGVKVSRDTCDPSAVLVSPGSLENSYVMHKITGIGMCPGTSQMPKAGAPLPSSEIQTIADWICQGAKND